MEVVFNGLPSSPRSESYLQTDCPGWLFCVSNDVIAHAGPIQVFDWATPRNWLLLNRIYNPEKNSSAWVFDGKHECSIEGLAFVRSLIPSIITSTKTSITWKIFRANDLSLSLRKRVCLCSTEINECAPSPCGKNSITCVDLRNDFRCVCHAGYTGKTCQSGRSKYLLLWFTTNHLCAVLESGMDSLTSPDAFECSTWCT